MLGGTCAALPDRPASRCSPAHRHHPSSAAGVVRREVPAACDVVVLSVTVRDCRRGCVKCIAILSYRQVLLLYVLVILLYVLLQDFETGLWAEHNQFSSLRKGGEVWVCAKHGWKFEANMKEYGEQSVEKRGC